jgi:hypothetical protein
VAELAMSLLRATGSSVKWADAYSDEFQLKDIEDNVWAVQIWLCQRNEYDNLEDAEKLKLPAPFDKKSFFLALLGQQVSIHEAPEGSVILQMASTSALVSFFEDGSGCPRSHPVRLSGPPLEPEDDYTSGQRAMIRMLAESLECSIYDSYNRKVM